MKLFVSLAPPRELHTTLTRSFFPLREGVAGARWTKTEQFHFTLRFIGPSDNVPALEVACREAARNAVPFDLELRGLGVFPTDGNPQVLWAGVGAGGDALNRLAADLESRLGRAGFPPAEHPFQPHLTLARFTGAPRLPDGFLAAHADRPWFSFRADKIAVMESQPTAYGVNHYTRSAFFLGAAG
ncbi:MAG TPA: RNA 2',3'-cyclic phosphodiesterase [Elusimicrobiota bacterium]|jgi:2'-5' RNA ligase|nr:RNA 2',3'-cyclic phosphodiesterase [Elusimicrobiota bacterium]HMX42227.1 RNA 2',3'-cyclic phosphodiesterase [Elusimicrobiota bacterium]HMX95703.1 RNA 2',3'-cyclic phosphodiesterase [Elusimicrobiota bacterium]HMZ26617.1 RNA 2',3'-cyclic phosphodiesterase [Elusimicrobiota bacterium]HNA59784.1 RNA 2',3'-cyclic phosphodiesterase [Elusimicrobiota bacterium]